MSQHFKCTVLPEMPIEAECSANLSDFENGKGDGVTQAPVFICMAQEKVFGPLFFARKNANHWQAALKQPFESQCAS